MLENCFSLFNLIPEKIKHLLRCLILSLPRKLMDVVEGVPVQGRELELGDL